MRLGLLWLSGGIVLLLSKLVECVDQALHCLPLCGRCWLLLHLLRAWLRSCLDACIRSLFSCRVRLTNVLLLLQDLRLTKRLTLNALLHFYSRVGLDCLALVILGTLSLLLCRRLLYHSHGSAALDLWGGPLVFRCLGRCLGRLGCHLLLL